MSVAFLHLSFLDSPSDFVLDVSICGLSSEMQAITYPTRTQLAANTAVNAAKVELPNRKVDMKQGRKNQVDSPFQIYLRDAKYKVSGTIASEMANAISFARTLPNK